MFTLFGQEAVEGDYVICEWHRYSYRSCGQPNFIAGIVHNNKVYTPYIIQNKDLKMQWVRKTVAIVKISKEDAKAHFDNCSGFGSDADFDKEIEACVNAEKVTDVPDNWTEHRRLY